MRARKKETPRDRLLDTAGGLFRSHGFRAIGIDRILAESGVAKMTLYRHFESKDALIAAYLQSADAEFWGWAEAAMEVAMTAEEKLLALFEAVGKLASSPECLGCVFQGAAMAFADADHPGRQVAVRHKRAVRERLVDLARKARLRDPERLGEQLALLIDGAWIAARTFREGDNPARDIVGAAKTLIDAHR